MHSTWTSWWCKHALPLAVDNRSEGNDRPGTVTDAPPMHSISNSWLLGTSFVANDSSEVEESLF